MSETTVAVIEAVTSKEGATNGKPWRKFSVKTEDGFYSTFDKQVAEQAHALVGEKATIMWKPSGNEGQFRDIIAAKAAEDSTTPPDGIPSEPASKSDADWSEIGLRKTRCLLWAHYLSSPLAASIAATANEQPASARVYNFGAILIALAEADIYHRPPAEADEDGLPF